MVIQSKVCSVRLCHKPIYDGSSGPEDFEEGDTTLCKEHYFEYITMHDVIYTTENHPRRALEQIGPIDYEAIRMRSREKNPANYSQEIPWERSQSDCPWRETDDEC